MKVNYTTIKKVYKSTKELVENAAATQRAFQKAVDEEHAHSLASSMHHQEYLEAMKKVESMLGQAQTYYKEFDEKLPKLNFFEKPKANKLVSSGSQMLQKQLDECRAAIALLRGEQS